MDNNELIERREAVLGRNTPVFYDEPAYAFFYCYSGNVSNAKSHTTLVSVWRSILKNAGLHATSV